MLSPVSELWAHVTSNNREQYLLDLGVRVRVRVSEKSIEWEWVKFLSHWLSDKFWKISLLLQKHGCVLYYLPSLVISRSRHFWSRISEKRRVLKTKLLLHKKKLYLTYGMVLRFVTLSDLSWASCCVNERGKIALLEVIIRKKDFTVINIRRSYQISSN